ncbi:cytochrome P450 [Rhodocollybia butyracea]|uniref:Cytochrome P450 n=1 Tax=Rhodocollybia butyracea TaxID=206335 RepID=A0A9P5PUW5_9AGAR|nr:cytochrome P450 [Rhodocollybia butyracea]
MTRNEFKLGRVQSPLDENESGTVTVPSLSERFGSTSISLPSLSMINNSYSFPFSVFILGTSYFFWRYIQHKRSAPHKLLMPTSKQTSWIWGNELKIFQREASEIYVEWAASLGLVYRIKAALFQSDIIIVGDNSAAQHIFQNSYTYVKAPAFLRLVERLAGKCLAWAEGEDHKYQRRLLAPAFTSGAVEAMTDDIFSCVEKMSQNLRTLTGPDANVVDMAPVISTCALDIIGRVGFGHDFESTEVKAIRSAWHQHVVMSRTFAGFMAPILISVFPWITKLPLPVFRDSAVRPITYKLAGRLLSENSGNTNVLHGNDILSILVNSRSDSKGDLEAQLTTTELLDNIAFFMMAGHETTAVAVDSLLLELAQNPTIQRKLRHEIRTVASLDYHNIVTLEYLDAVTKEGLRLHPVTAATERIALQDDVIPLKQAILNENGKTVSSLVIKAGQVFRIPWTVLNVNEQVWGSNASQFIPERWIQPGGVPSADKLPHGPWGGVSSFCDGPRTCIGYRLAVLEIKIILAVLMLSFEFECTEAKIVQYLAPTLQPFADGKPVSMPLKVSLVPDL